MLVKNYTTDSYYWRGEEITEAEYNRIKSIIDNRPTAPSGYGYRLTADLEWELYELPIIEDDPIDGLT